MPSAKQNGLTFRCYSCSREFHWRDDLPGRTIRCTCGVKFKCPDLTADSHVARESLEDTVADVDLNEAFDNLDDPHGDGESAARSIEGGPQDLKEKGFLGLGPAGETLLWGVGALLGVASGILAIIVGAWLYIVCAVVLSVSLIKFRSAWQRWTRGRPWMQCLMETLEGNESTAS